MAKKITQAGQLDRLLTILRRDGVRNAHSGEVTNVRTPIHSDLPCAKQELSTEEDATESGRTTATAKTLFTVRYLTGIRETDLVSCEGVTYRLTGIREGEGRYQWTVLEAERVDVGV